MSGAVWLLMHPRCRRVTAFLVSTLLRRPRQRSPGWDPGDRHPGQQSIQRRGLRHRRREPAQCNRLAQRSGWITWFGNASSALGLWDLPS